MAITYVGGQENSYLTPSSPLTISVNIGTRSNGLLVVCLGHTTSAVFDSLILTYGGTAMSQAVLYREASYLAFSAIYYLANPPNGTNDLVITFLVASGGSWNFAYVLSAWYDGAHQTQGAALDQTNSGGGNTDPSLDITPGQDNELVTGIYSSKADNVLAVGSGETLIQDHDFGGDCCGVSYAIQTTAQTQTVDFSGADDNWTMAVASFKQAAAVGSLIVPHRINTLIRM